MSSATVTQEFTHLLPYTYPQNYVGESYYGTYTVYGVHRDSTLLAQSNFDVLYDRISKALEQLNLEIDDYLQITRANHWAVGWLDTLRLDQNAPVEVLTLADNLLAEIDDYPILDENDYSDRQFNAIWAYWQSLPDYERRNLCRQTHVDARRIAVGDMPSEVFDHLSEWSDFN